MTVDELLRSGMARETAEGLRVRAPVSGEELLFLAMTDLDGTVNDEHVVESLRLGTIGPARDAFRRMADAGWATGICTARSTGEAREYREQLGVCGPIISENGAMVVFPDGHERVLGRAGQLEEALTRIEAELGRRVPSSLDPEWLERIWTEEQAGRAEVLLGHPDRDALRRAVDRRASCFLVGLTTVEKERVRRVAAELGLDCFGHLLHLIPAGADKGSALRELLVGLEAEVTRRESRRVRVVPVVFGNGENDLPLFGEALRRGGVAVLVGDVASPGGFHFDTSRHPIPEGTLCMTGRSHGHGILDSLPRVGRILLERYGVQFPW